MRVQGQFRIGELFIEDFFCAVQDLLLKRRNFYESILSYFFSGRLRDYNIMTLMQYLHPF